MLLNNLQNRVVQMPVRGQNIGLRGGERIAAASRHSTPGFFDEQSSGSKVPGVQLVLEESAERTHADGTEIERRGAETADAVNLLTEQIANGSQSRLHHRAAVVVESDADQHLGQSPVIGHLHFAVVVECSPTSNRGEPL